jgi:type II secretion system protein N
MALVLPHLGPRTRKIVRIAGFVLFGLVTFVFALQLSLPYERAKDRAVDILAEHNWDLTTGEVEPGWLPGRVYFHDVKLVSRTTKADEVATVIIIPKLKIDVGVLALLGGTLAVDIDAKVGSGHLTAKLDAPISFGKGTYTIKVDGKDLPSGALPMKDIVSQPTTGDIGISADISVVVEANKAGKVGVNWQKLEGEAELSCPSNCVYGDGKTKLKMKIKNQRNAEFAKDGIEFGTIKIDSMLARIEAKNGKVSLAKFDAKSADGDLKAEFTMDLQPDINESGVAGCLSYKGSEELLKRDEKSFNAITLIGGALGPDKLFHVRLSDKWRDIRKVGAVCGGPGTSMDDPGGTNPGVTRRPNLTVTPEENPHPPITPVTPPPPPPPVTPPPATGSAPAPATGSAPPPATGSAVPGGVPEGSAGSGSAEGSAAPPPPGP